MRILWVDDLRRPPQCGVYVWAKSVNEAIALLQKDQDWDCLDLDHDAGDYAKDGGDYIRILDWLEKQNMKFNIHIHSFNPVGRLNMRAIITKNHWHEIP